MKTRLVPGRRSCLESSGESPLLQRSYGRLEHWPLREAEEVERYGLGITRCSRCNHIIFPDRAYDTNEGWIWRDIERSCFYSKTKRF